MQISQLLQEGFSGDVTTRRRQYLQNELRLFYKGLHTKHWGEPTVAVDWAEIGRSYAGRRQLNDLTLLRDALPIPSADVAKVDRTVVPPDANNPAVAPHVPRLEDATGAIGGTSADSGNVIVLRRLVNGRPVDFVLPVATSQVNQERLIATVLFDGDTVQVLDPVGHPFVVAGRFQQAMLSLRPPAAAAGHKNKVKDQDKHPRLSLPRVHFRVAGYELIP